MGQRPFGIPTLVLTCALAFVATGAAATARPTLAGPVRRHTVTPPALRSNHDGGRTWRRSGLPRG